MSAARKKPALDGGVDDIVCGLPRHVLDKIFERLPVKDAARTSILSSKWRYLWSAYPYLVFDQQFFEKILANKPNSANKYVNVINKVLLGHDGPVFNFNIYIPNLHCDWDAHIDEWLLFLSRNGIEKLNLDYQCPTPYKLPSCVFSSPKLTKLKVINVIFKQPASFPGFANLVELHLEKITFASCALNGVSPVAPLLKKLYFDKCTGINFFNISAPQALYIFLTFSTGITPIFFDKFPPKLDVICIIIGKLQKFEYQGKGSLLNLCKLHEKFPKAAALGFDGCFLKLAAATSIERSLSFVFLVSLRLYFLSFDDLDQISCALWLFNSSPNLASFKGWVSPFKGKTVESVLNHLESPDCMSKMMKLRTVKFYLISGSKPELLFIKCILAHSPILETLHVKYSVVDKDQQLRISNELMRFPRSSNKAEVIYDADLVSFVL